MDSYIYISLAVIILLCVAYMLYRNYYCVPACPPPPKEEEKDCECVPKPITITEFTLDNNDPPLVKLTGENLDQIGDIKVLRLSTEEQDNIYTEVNDLNNFSIISSTEATGNLLENNSGNNKIIVSNKCGGEITVVERN